MATPSRVSALSSATSVNVFNSPALSLRPVMSDGEDTDYGDDDLELSQTDYDKIDAHVSAMYASAAHTNSKGSATDSPLLPIAFEAEADELDSVKESAQASNVKAKDKGKDAQSPYRRYRSWRKSLSVTDLVSPAWCELQVDYGLRGARHRKPAERPVSFVSGKGKEIVVRQKLAVAKDRVLERGKSVHKVLEKEVKPKEIIVKTATEEERWALQLVNMIADMESLVRRGFCREIPVFGVVHGIVVLGTIDEITRRPISTPPRQTHSEPAAHSNVPLTPAKRPSPSAQSTPSKRKSKRARPSDVEAPPPTETRPAQAQLTAFFPMSPSKRPRTPPPRDSDEMDLALDDGTAYSVGSPSRQSPSTATSFIRASPPHMEPGPSRARLEEEPERYILHLSDTKTRHRGSLPSDRDTLPSRLQLMLYHRLLSALLMPHKPSEPGLNKRRRSEEAFLSHSGFDFELFWRIVGVDEEKQLSDQFCGKAGLIVPGIVEDYGMPMLKEEGGTDELVLTLTVENVVKAWWDAVRRLELDPERVEKELEVVYRRPGKVQGEKRRTKSKKRRRSKDSRPDDATATVNDSAALCGAIMASMKTQDVQVELASRSDSQVDTEATAHDPELQWAIHHSLSGRKPTLDWPDDPGTPVITENEKEGSTSEEESEEDAVSDVKIVGSKRFDVDEELLEEHLTGVLEWWHGRRPPQGVEIEDSGRCFTCEYQDDCEWREAKAEEARVTLERKRSGADII